MSSFSSPSSSILSILILYQSIITTTNKQTGYEEISDSLSPSELRERFIYLGKLVRGGRKNEAKL